MGQEEERAARLEAFAGYTVDDALLKAAAPEAVVLHCLPAHRGEEISDSVLEGPQSVVWRQAAHRPDLTRRVARAARAAGTGAGTVKAGLHVGQLLQPVPGGIGRYIVHVARNLPAAGVEVVPFGAGAPSPRVQNLIGTTVDLGWPRGPIRYELWHQLRRPRVSLDVSVIHAPSLAIPAVRDVPLVVTVHDVAFLAPGEIPRTSSGKVRRHLCRTQYLVRQEKGA